MKQPPEEDSRQESEVRRKAGAVDGHIVLFGACRNLALTTDNQPIMVKIFSNKIDVYRRSPCILSTLAHAFSLELDNEARQRQQHQTF
ncbi:MAG: hypothetical protein ACKV2V_26025 [Blastocatellia bacterium]